MSSNKALQRERVLARKAAKERAKAAVRKSKGVSKHMMAKLERQLKG